jgi:hypothetical protein
MHGFVAAAIRLAGVLAVFAVWFLLLLIIAAHKEFRSSR